jgi:hypothetical protein
MEAVSKVAVAPEAMEAVSEVAVAPVPMEAVGEGAVPPVPMEAGMDYVAALVAMEVVTECVTVSPLPPRHVAAYPSQPQQNSRYPPPPSSLCPCPHSPQPPNQEAEAMAAQVPPAPYRFPPRGCHRTRDVSQSCPF